MSSGVALVIFDTSIQWYNVTGAGTGGGVAVQLRESQFERATELFYEAAAVPELWPNALQAVAEAAGALGSSLLPIRVGPDSTVGSPAIRGLVHDLVGGGWLRINPYMQRGLQLTASGWKGLITSEDMVTPEQKKRDPYINEVEVPNGFGPKVGIFLVSREPERALPITIERSLGADPYTRDEVAKLNRLMSRLNAAATLAMQVGFSAAIRVAESLAGTGKEVVLLSGSGRVLHVPESFDRFVGDVFSIRRGEISAWDRDADQRLSAAIARGVGSGSALTRVAEGVLLPRKSGKRPLLVEIVPIVDAGQDIFMLTRAAMVITDPEARPVGRSAVLAATFGLSPAEARLADRIGWGEELKDIADAEGIAIETARARLKAVFAKTGTHRQAELALLVAGFRY